MGNSRIEATIHALDGKRLERLMADLLEREGYDVDPTSTSGPDGGREAFLFAEGRDGILHCSVQDDWEGKAHDDAEKAETRFDQEFDFYIFATNADPAGSKRDRVEDELTEEWGMQANVWDYERIREKLVGNPENHGLIREHLSVDPARPFVSIESEIDDLYEDLLSRIQRREAPDGKIVEEGAIVAVHVLPQEAIDEHHDRYVGELPNPPLFDKKDGFSEERPKLKISKSTRRAGSNGRQRYTAIHRDGWTEGVLVENTIQTIRTSIDGNIVKFVDTSIAAFQEAEIPPPYFVYVAILDAEGYVIDIPFNMADPVGGQRKIADSEVRLNRVRIDDVEANVAEEMRKSLDQLWRYFGWEKSQSYKEITEDGETRYEFHPFS